MKPLLKVALLSIGASVNPFDLTAQITEAVEQHFLKANILTPGITYEKGIAANANLNVEGLMGFVFHATIGNTNNSSLEDFFIMYPSLSTTLQYYFNRAKREQRGRPLYKNSGMFIGPQFIVQGPDFVNTNPNYIDLRAALAVGGVWGIQRTFKSNVNIALNLGMGYTSTFDSADALDGFTFLNKLLIGYVILPRKEKRPQLEMPDDYKY